MLQIALIAQFVSILFFLVAYATRNDPSPNQPLVGRTYDYYLGSTPAYYAQLKVIAVKDGWVKCAHYVFEPTKEREDVMTLEQFKRYSTLVPVKVDPFAGEAGQPAHKP